MTGFVSRPPSADTEPPGVVTPDLVVGDGWWPDINIVDLRNCVRIETTVTAERLREAVRNAMIDLANQMAAWRALREAEGHANLQAVPQGTVGGEKVKVVLYSRAIASSVAADLAERGRSGDATNSGHDRADELSCSADDHRRNARWAVSDLVERRRTTVELI